MKRISVICCIYNSYPVVRRCLDAFKSLTDHEEVEIILVDNHPPDIEASRYILDMAKEEHGTRNGFVRVVKTNKNLGCHGGWNFGYEFATGEFVCKLDDDTVILTPHWHDKMYKALTAVADLGYLSADIDAKQANIYEIVRRQGYELEIAKNGVVGFSLVMFRRSDIQRWGPMKTGPYRAAGGKPIITDRLYGGEEVHYANAARGEGKVIAHFPAVKCHHMDNSDRHPDYAMWKRAYGYHGWTSKDMETWIADGEHIYHYCNAIAQELNNPNRNEVLLRDWTKRLGEVGEPKHIELIEHVILRVNNDVVKHTARQAVHEIMQRVRK